MDFFKHIQNSFADLTIFDFSLFKISVFFFTLFLITGWTGLRNLYCDLNGTGIF